MAKQRESAGEMEVTCKDTPEFELLPDDEYLKAEVKEITKSESKFGGDTLMFAFTLEDHQDEEGEQRLAFGFCSPKFNRGPKNQSKLYAWAAILMEQEWDVGDNFNVGELIGKKCRVLLKTYTTKATDDAPEGQERQKVVEVKPYKSSSEKKVGKGTTPAPKTKEPDPTGDIFNLNEECQELAKAALREMKKQDVIAFMKKYEVKAIADLPSEKWDDICEELGIEKPKPKAKAKGGKGAEEGDMDLSFLDA